MTTSMEWAIPAVVNENISQRLGKLLRLTKLCIVSVALAREQRMDAMVKIVAPNTIESISTFAARRNQAHVVLVRFRDHDDASALPTGHPLHGFLHFRQDMQCARVINGLHRVQRKPSMWKSRIHIAALSSTSLRTASLSGPSKLSACPHGVW